jgi:hypothetical protein
MKIPVPTEQQPSYPVTKDTITAERNFFFLVTTCLPVFSYLLAIKKTPAFLV